MVAKRKLTIETLSKLGRRKLAELLIAEAAGNRQLTRTLNLAISAEEGPAALGASLGTRLATLARSRSVLSYDEGRELIAELDGLRTTIVETIGPQESRLNPRQSRGRRSGQLQRPVVVAMIAVRMMQPPIHKVVDMVAVRHRFVSAGGAVRM